MNHTDFSDNECNHIEYLKRATTLLFRIHRWSHRNYFYLIDLLSKTHKFLAPEDIFQLGSDGIVPTYKKALTILDNNGFMIFEKQELIFLDKAEESFYKSLPNDIDLLLDGIYFFLLPQENQIDFLFSNISPLIYNSQDTLPSTLSHQEKGLVSEFRFLSKSKKAQVLDFITFLSFKQDHLLDALRKKTE